MLQRQLQSTTSLFMPAVLRKPLRAALRRITGLVATMDSDSVSTATTTTAPVMNWGQGQAVRLHRHALMAY